MATFKVTQQVRSQIQACLEAGGDAEALKGLLLEGQRAGLIFAVTQFCREMYIQTLGRVAFDYNCGDMVVTVAGDEAFFELTITEEGVVTIDRLPKVGEAKGDLVALGNTVYLGGECFFRHDNLGGTVTYFYSSEEEAVAITL